MKRRLITIAAAFAVGMIVVASGAAADRTASLRATDLFVFGTDQSLMQNAPSLSRVGADGTVKWSIPIEGIQGELTLNYFAADRNTTEDSFYIYVSDAGRNPLGGLGQLRRYDARGKMTWAIGVPAIDDQWVTQAVTVSANPVRGGVYTANFDGVTRIDRKGSVLWGPTNFGYGSGGFWSVVTNARDGGAYAINRSAGKLLRITGDGVVQWASDVGEPETVMYSPSDGGAYVGSGSYSATTVKFDATGTVSWTLPTFPSPYTYGRAVDPSDGSLYVTSGWDARIGHVAADGTVLHDVYLSGAWGGIANQGLAVSQSGSTLYTGNSASDLGVDAYRFTGFDTMERLWRADPGWYAMTGDAYQPYYRPYVGMPRLR